MWVLTRTFNLRNGYPGYHLSFPPRSNESAGGGPVPTIVNHCDIHSSISSGFTTCRASCDLHMARPLTSLGVTTSRVASRIFLHSAPLAHPKTSFRFLRHCIATPARVHCAAADARLTARCLASLRGCSYPGFRANESHVFVREHDMLHCANPGCVSCAHIYRLLVWCAYISPACVVRIYIACLCGAHIYRLLVWCAYISTACVVRIYIGYLCGAHIYRLLVCVLLRLRFRSSRAVVEFRQYHSLMVRCIL